MLSTIQSATLRGIDGSRVTVEVHVSNGLPGFTVVGLPDAAVRESRDRVRAAVLSSNLSWPLRRVTVNLAPSGVRKGGAGLDLPIAIGLLVASGAVPAAAVDGMAFLGELGLDGSVREIPGTLALVAAMQSEQVVVPSGSAVEAALVDGRMVHAVSSLCEAVDALCGRRPWPPHPEPEPQGSAPPAPDLAEVRGQALGRRAAEVSAAGGHHLLLVGPPGSGKTMIATRIPGLLPPLELSDSLQVSRVYSAAGVLPDNNSLLPERPPFRAPHHSASVVSLVGGGGVTTLRPGELSLAHGGVLFLDELGEFPMAVLDMLRQPLEEGVVRISRARETATMPARVLLVAAMNPCPCGEGSTSGACSCGPNARARYVRRLSGPLLDRFDLAVSLDRPDPGELLHGKSAEASQAVARRVLEVRELAAQRGVRCNAELSDSALREVAPLIGEAETLLERRLRSGVLSARGLDRVRRVARTIADLAGRQLLEAEHVAEALQLRAARSALLPGDPR